MTIKETTTYESLISVKQTQQAATLEDFVEVQEPDANSVDDWQKHWVGMPAYNQEDQKAYKQIYVNFESEADYQAFAQLVNQNLSKKTKSIWYPKKAADENSLHRWIEDQ